MGWRKRLLGQPHSPPPACCGVALESITGVSGKSGGMLVWGTPFPWLPAARFHPCIFGISLDWLTDGGI